MLSVIGAGAMGTALAVHCLRAGTPATLLATGLDEAVIDAQRRGQPHPTLGVPIPAGVDCVEADKWDEPLRRAEVVFVAVSSHGIDAVVRRAAAMADPNATWIVATKGWDERTLQSCSEVVESLMPEGAAVASLGGPALAPELVAGVPTAIVCASRARRRPRPGERDPRDAHAVRRHDRRRTRCRDRRRVQERCRGRRRHVRRPVGTPDRERLRAPVRQHASGSVRGGCARDDAPRDCARRSARRPCSAWPAPAICT